MSGALLAAGCAWATRPTSGAPAASTADAFRNDRRESSGRIARCMVSWMVERCAANGRGKQLLAESIQFGRRGPPHPSPLPEEREHFSPALENSLNGDLLLPRQIVRPRSVLRPLVIFVTLPNGS